MNAWDKVRVELEEQRCLIEQQQITIQRQQRKIDLQLRLMAEMQAELRRIQLTLQRAAPLLYPLQASSSDGKGNVQRLATGRHRPALSPGVSQ